MEIKKEFTIYHTRITKTKWVGPMVEGIRRYYTGKVDHVIQGVDEKIYIGTTECSRNDDFNKRIARNIARGRAIMCMRLVENGASMPTKRITTTTPTIEGYHYTHVEPDANSLSYRAKYNIRKNKLPDIEIFGQLGRVV